MRLILSLFLTSALIFSSSQIVAQNKVNKRELARYMKLANKSFESYNFQVAMNYYTKALEISPKEYEAIYKLAECQRAQRLYRDALENYEKVTFNANATYPNARFWQGMMYKSLGNYEKALRSLERFNATQINYDAYHELAAQEIELIKSIDPILNRPPNAIIIPLDHTINDKKLDNFSAVTSSRGEIVFTSPVKLGDSATSEMRKTFYSNRIFTAYPTDMQGSYKHKKMLDIPFKSKSDLAGNPSFSKDGKRIYYTVCSDGENGRECFIYVSSKKADGWSPPSKLPTSVNVDGYVSMHPMIGVNSETKKEVLFFASNRPGGLGGLDIWYAELNKSGRPSKSQNAGKNVNTVGDERAPFYSSRYKSLFFSSNGYTGLGEFDIFYVQGDALKSEWDLVKNIGHPINSSADDYYFYLNKDGETGFFTSNRPNPEAGNTTCCDNIYSFVLTEELKIEKVVNITGVVLQDGFDAATVYLLNGDKEIIDSVKTDLLGGYRFENLPPNEQYGIKINKKNVEVKSDLFITEKNGMILEKGFAVAPNSYKFRELSANQNHIALLDFNDPELYRLEGAVGIIGKAVSQNNPVMPVKGLNVYLYDAPENLIDSTKTDDEGKFNFENLEKDQNYLVKLDEYVEDLFAEMLLINNEDKEVVKTATSLDMDEDGFFHFKKLPFVASRLDNATQIDPKADLKIAGAALGQRFRLKNILFETSKYDILEASYSELDRLYQQLMDNSKVKIEIAGHTDNTGLERSNIMLSRERANAVKKYLMKKGITESRMIAMGYGSINPIKSNDTEEGRKMNRRVEIIIKSK